MQITSRKSWKVRGGDFIPMTFECILLAMPLIALSLFLNRVPAANSAIVTSCSTAIEPVQQAQPQLLIDIVTGIGAGIYEELIFRLILISLLMLVFQDLLKFTNKNAIIFSVLISAALFSVHHNIFYLDGTFETAEVFTAARFIFRTAAGIYFAAIFAIRGFGIAAGAHAFYDIIAAILNALFVE
jgi:membrane protease YdiL (CAAX protease family)